MIHFKNKRIGAPLLIAVACLSIFMIGAHVFGAVLLSNAVIGAFSLHSLILYVLIGLVIGVVVLFKFKHLVGHFQTRKESK